MHAFACADLAGHDGRRDRFRPAESAAPSRSNWPPPGPTCLVHARGNRAGAEAVADRSPPPRRQVTRRAVRPGRRRPRTSRWSNGAWAWRGPRRHLGQQRRRRRPDRRGHWLGLSSASSSNCCSVDVAATMHLVAGRSAQRMKARGSGRDRQHRLGPGRARHGRRQRSIVRRHQGRRDGLSPEPGSLAGPRGARQLRGAGLDSNQVGRQRLGRLATAGQRRSAAGAVGHARGRGRCGAISGLAGGRRSSRRKPLPSTAA